MNSALRTQRLPQLVLGLVLLVVALLYLRSALVLPFGDDWSHIERAREYGFAILFPQQFFRPFERLVNAINYAFFDVLGPITIGANILVLIATALALRQLASRLAPANPWFACLAACLFAIHPGNAASAIQIDTFSQCLAALFAVLCTRFIVFRESGVPALPLWQAGLLVFATLCAKETSVGFVGALPIAVYLKLRRCDGVDPGVARPQAIRVGIAAFVALVAYLGLRLAFQAALSGDPSGRYAFTFRPFPLAMNVLNLSVGSVFFGDSAHWRAWAFDTTKTVGLAVTIVVLAAVATGLLRLSRLKDEQRQGLRGADLQVLLLLLLSGLFPSLLLNKVSEQYLPGLTPFSSLLCAAGLCLLLAPLRSRSAAFVGIIIAATLWCGAIIDNKQKMHAQLSARHWAFVRELSRELPRCSGTDGIVVTGNLDDKTQGRRSYSVFSASNAEVIDGAAHALRAPQLAPILQRAANEPPSGLLGATIDASRCERVSTSACELLCLSPDADAHPRRSCRMLDEECDAAAP